MFQRQRVHLLLLHLLELLFPVLEQLTVLHGGCLFHRGVRAVIRVPADAFAVQFILRTAEE